MQTSKWGPHAWKFLHTIAHNYQPGVHNRESFKLLFTTILADTLPCKYCRESYKQFSSELPIDPYLDVQDGLHYWLYQIHNKVNKKLRDQGLLDTPDPTFESVCKKFDTWKADCSKKQGTPTTCRMPSVKQRCTACTKKGRQCSRIKADGKMRCNQHLKLKSKKYTHKGKVQSNKTK